MSKDRVIAYSQGPQGISSVYETTVDISAIPADHPNRDLAVAVLVEYRVGAIGAKRAMDDLRYYLLEHQR